MGVAVAVLHPCEGKQQTVAVFFLIFQFEVHQLVALVNGSTLNDFVTGKDAIYDMYVSVGGAHLNGDGLTVGDAQAIQKYLLKLVTELPIK